MAHYPSMMILEFDQHSWALNPDQTLYDALHRHGLTVRKACVNGVCGICRCRLVAGQIDYRGRAPYGLDETARIAGFILPCIAYPQGDVSLSELRLDKGNSEKRLI